MTAKTSVEKERMNQVNTNELGQAEFTRKYCNPSEPVLIKDEAIGWEATKKWNPEYLNCLLGNQEVRVTFHEEGILGRTVDRDVETLPFSEAHSCILDDGRYYVNRMAIERTLISRLTTGKDSKCSFLAEDIQQPRFLDDWSKIHHVTMFWYGGDRCKSALHWDTFDNLFVQIFGEKRFLLFSPTQTEYLYPVYGSDGPTASRINVFDSEETQSKFPRFEQAEFIDLTLEPGDMLFIPKGWWHAADSLTTSISVNFWWLKPYPYLRILAGILSERYNWNIPDRIKHSNPTSP